MKNISESLAGRIGILELYPLSNREIENKKDEIFCQYMKNLKIEKEPID